MAQGAGAQPRAPEGDTHARSENRLQDHGVASQIELPRLDTDSRQIRPSSALPVDGRPRRNQRQVHVLKRLGVTRKEISARRELPDELFQKPNLSCPVEIDDDVSAKDDFRRFGQAKVRIHEVETPKLDLRAQLGNDANQIGPADRGCA